MTEKNRAPKAQKGKGRFNLPWPPSIPLSIAAVRQSPLWQKGLAVLVLLLSIVWVIDFSIGWNRSSQFLPQEWLIAGDAYRATVRRDQWGVPFIEGKRDLDIAFASAYVQATDALEDFEQSIRIHKGMMGLRNGTEGLQTDWLLALVRSRQLANTGWLELPQNLRDLLTAFAAGANYYAAENPDRVDQTLYPITGEDLIAAMHFQQLLFYGFADTVQQLLAGEVPQTAPRGSNAIAISPGRGWGATRLLINSHQPLTGPFSWYEIGVSSEEGWEMYGGTFPGSPFIYLGANPNLGWGATVNKPGLMDLYRLEIHPRNPRRYRLDGTWWDMEVEEVNLPFKLIGNLYWSVDQEFEFTKHGPVFRTDEGVFALRYAGATEIGQAMQWYRMNKAKNRDEWRAAMRMQAIPSLNFVYADAKGNLDFLYNAAIRNRPDDVAPDAPLDGTISSLIELTPIPFDRLPQVHNPSSGWIASTNQTPLLVSSPFDNPRAADFPDHWRIEKTINNRSLRVSELLSRSGPVDGERLKEIKMDKIYSPRFRHLDWIDSIKEGFDPDDRLLEDVQRELLQWDFSADKDNQFAALGICMAEASSAAERNGETFQLIASMRSCGTYLSEHFGTLALPLGDVVRLRRGANSWGLGGGPDLLRAIYSEPSEDGTRTAVAGDGLTIFVEWQEGKFSVESIHQFGSSRDPVSLNYADQAPLFADEKLRDPFNPSDLPASAISVRQPIPY